MVEGNFKKPFEFHKFSEIFYLWHDQTQEHEFRCFYAMSIHKNHSKTQRYETEPDLEAFKISKF